MQSREKPRKQRYIPERVRLVERWLNKSASSKSRENFRQKQKTKKNTYLGTWDSCKKAQGHWRLRMSLERFRKINWPLAHKKKNTDSGSDWLDPGVIRNPQAERTKHTVRTTGAPPSGSTGSLGDLPYQNSMNTIPKRSEQRQSPLWAVF